MPWNAVHVPVESVFTIPWKLCSPSRGIRSGGKTVLQGISKRGDTYLRTLLIHGARSVIFRAKHNAQNKSSWLHKVIERRNANVATVALANKNARILWALLAKDREFRADYATTA